LSDYNSKDKFLVSRFAGTKEDYRGSMEHLSELYSGSRRSSEDDEQETPEMLYTLEVINRRLREKRLDAGRPQELGVSVEFAYFLVNIVKFVAL
jgi:hypothetical protein